MEPLPAHSVISLCWLSKYFFRPAIPRANSCRSVMVFLTVVLGPDRNGPQMAPIDDSFRTGNEAMKTLVGPLPEGPWSATVSLIVRPI